MIIEVDTLYKTYKSRKKENLLKTIFSPSYTSLHAVKGISFSINKGEAVAFLGPNGAGKTTTMKMLSGLLYPTKGNVKVLGFTPFDRKVEFLKKIGLVMGNKSSLEWDLTALQSFSLFQKIYEIPKSTFEIRVEEYTTMLGTKHVLDKPIRKLSLGERLKMELIGTLLYEPEVLFLDEPTIGLDVPSKHTIREFLRHIQRDSGVTLLLTSHDMDDIEKVCDRVIVINQGEKVFDNSLEKLTKHYNQEKFIKVSFDTLPSNEKISKIAPVIEQDEHSYTLKVKREEMPDALASLTSKFDLIDVDIISVPLDEIISDLYKQTSKDGE